MTLYVLYTLFFTYLHIAYLRCENLKKNTDCYMQTKVKERKDWKYELRLFTFSIKSVHFYPGQDEILAFLFLIRSDFKVQTIHVIVNKKNKVNLPCIQAQDTGSFLAITLGSALIHTKRNFDRLMQVNQILKSKNAN